MLFDLGAIGGTALYYVTRNNELHRLRSFSLSLNLVWGLTWRVLIATVFADQVSRRLFVNSYKLKEH